MLMHLFSVQGCESTAIFVTYLGKIRVPSLEWKPE